MQRELRDGLILRTLADGIASDRERLPQFYVDVFSEEGDSEAHMLDAWTDELIDANPVMSPDDFFVVVDPAHDDKIVSALLLIPQTWLYDGIELGVGRIELVATLKAYRRRGLVRHLMQAIHERSAALGHHITAITGIPYFYRQFGYAMTVDLGFRTVFHLPPTLANDETQPAYVLRLATTDDIPALIALDADAASHSKLYTPRDEASWRFDIAGRYERSVDRLAVLLIVPQVQPQNPVGYVALGANEPGGIFVRCRHYVVGDDASILSTYQDVLRGIRQWFNGQFPDNTKMQFVAFSTGQSETLDLLAERTAGAHNEDYAYAWYMRVPDYPRFFMQIAPVLQARLAHSGANRFTGTFKINLYERDWLLLTFADGCLTDAQTMPPDQLPEKTDALAAFPYHTFNHLIFGQHSYEDLRPTMVDLSVNATARALLPILFPKKRSALLAIV